MKFLFCSMKLFIENLHRFVCRYGVPPERSRSLAIPCFTNGEVFLRGASELANTKSASKMTCRHMMTSQFRSERGKTRKREISRDFSRFFDPEFLRNFIDPFCPFRCCVRTRTHEKGFLRLPESNRFCGRLRTREGGGQRKKVLRSKKPRDVKRFRTDLNRRI